MDTKADKLSDNKQQEEKDKNHQEIVGMLEANTLNPYKITCVIDTSRIEPVKALGLCEQFKDLVKSKIIGYIKEQQRLTQINNKGMFRNFLKKK